MTTSEVESRNITISMRKSMENLVISSQDAIGQSISQALTFSGVITQHTNIIHENRSVSRSPSPSLRSADCGPESLENEKVTEAWLLQSEGCSQAHSDSASVSSGEVVTVVNAPPKTDNPKSSQNPGGRSLDGAVAAGSRTKKKSWYNSLYPTYKSKCDDFKRLFKDLPDDERLIVDYSCALQKDILAHGRLYASQNFLCFYASFFSWETSLTLRWKEVTAITKEKTALVIPNAILVCTESEKNFLTSFSGRDKAYLMLFRIWQNALMDQPMSSQEIWQWVHNCYGEELGFNSDEEGYMREGIDDVSAIPAEVLEDQVDSSSVDASGGADTREDNKSNRSASHGRDSSPPLENKRNNTHVNGANRFSEMSRVLDFWRVVDGCEIGTAAAPVTNGDADEREEEGGDTLPTDMSDTSESEPDKPNNGGEMEKCSEPHDGKLMLRQQFPFNIDTMFTMIFTNSKFQLELLAARGTTDYVQAPWQVQNGRKCRQISYRLSLSTGPIGPKEVHVTETQVMNKCSKPGVLYSIEVTSDNSGIPYADYISVIAHYCLTRVAESVTELCLYGSIKYKRNMWPMVKAFMEKNALGGLEEFGRLLAARLTGEAECGAPQARKGRRHRRLTVSSPEASAASGGAPAAGRAALRPAAAPRAPAPRPAPSGWLVGSLVLLLVVNGLLYWKLYCADRTGALHLDDLQNRMNSVSESAMSDWSKLLEAHSHRQRGELLAWRAALQRTVQYLAQTEQALTKLLETIKPSLDGTERRHDERTEL